MLDINKVITNFIKAAYKLIIAYSLKVLTSVSKNIRNIGLLLF